MGMGSGVFLIAVGGALVSYAAVQVRFATARSAPVRRIIRFAPTQEENARSEESDAAVDEIAHLLAALERVTEERDKARQELMELQDRWSW